MTSPELILVMIVRNEAQVIERCLNSVRSLISGWVIVDTGSTDDTVAIIENALADLPGEVHRREWIDFGHNRNEALALARGRGTHLLLIDADMTLRIEGELPELSADAYELRHDADPTYWIPRLVRSDYEWLYVGRTHEYLSCAKRYEKEQLTQLVIEDHADGGSRANKYERDRQLLEATLAENPNDGRAMLYLALTLRSLNETDGAIEMFQRRIAFGGWDQEVFYSLYQIGQLLLPSNPEAAILQFLTAWNFRPTRAEPLFELARLHRQRGQYALCELYASTGLSLPPTTDSAFVHTDAQNWGLRFELAIAWFHLGRISDALDLNNELLADGVPSAIEPWVRHNRAWCLQALGQTDGEAAAHLHMGADLPALTSLLPSTTYKQIFIDHDEGWSLFNPSITEDPNGGFALIARSSNYTIAEDGSYVFHTDAADEIIRTVNHVVRVTSDLDVSPMSRLPVQPDGPTVRMSRVIGCEDMRLVSVGSSWQALATVRDRNHYERCDIAVIDIPDLANPESVSLAVVPGPDPARHEKNWMPFVEDDELRILYLCAPTIVGHLDAQSELIVDSTAEGPPVAANFRGGSQGIPLNDGVLFLVHEVVFDAGRRIYGHRFIHLTKSRLKNNRVAWKITSMSQPFYFRELGIEFAAGLARNGDSLIATFGVRDAEAWFAEFTQAEVASLLVPLVERT